MNYNLSAPFHRASLDHADRLALVGEREALTYREAAGYARAVAAALGSAGRRGARVAILGSRSLEACLAVLGACWCGAAYVPLNLKLPPERLIGLLRESRFDAIVCDAAGETLLSPDLLDAAPERVLLTDRRGERQWPGRVIWRLNAPLDGDGPAEIDGEDLAYVESPPEAPALPRA